MLACTHACRQCTGQQHQKESNSCISSGNVVQCSVLVHARICRHLRKQQVMVVTYSLLRAKGGTFDVACPSTQIAMRGYILS